MGWPLRADTILDTGDWLGCISRSNSRDVPSGVGTVAWKLQREIILLLGWGPAILLQLAHPLVARGVADHSAFRTERWGRMRRLYRTLDAMLGLCFKAEPEALAVVARINAIHDRVNGRLTEAAGIFPVGTAYSAHDPNLLAWVHATLLDSFLLTYERFVAPLTSSERDRYCREAEDGGPLLGIPPGLLPRSAAELTSYMDRMAASGEIAVTDTARRLAREVLEPHAAWPVRCLVGLGRLPAVGLLPAAIRDAYGFTWTAGQERRLAILSAAVRRTLPLASPLVRYWPAARRAAARAAT
jgi:uncharacterized protein (DUF2236 family)